MCPVCLNSYKSPVTLKSHRCDPQKTKAPLCCECCKQEFKTEHKLYDHKCQRVVRITKKKEEPKYVCEFCKVGYKSEAGYLKHKCKYRKRLNFKNEMFFRIGFNSFIKFHQKFHFKTKTKTVFDFILSTYYDDFIKFGEYAMAIGMTRVEEYINFLIKNDVGIKDWTNDKIYELFIVEKLKYEDAFDAIKRSMSTAERWAIKNQKSINDYFREAGSRTIISNIKAGKVSPWFIYNTKSGKDFIKRLDDHSIKSIIEAIDPKFWGGKFKDTPYTNDIKDVLKNAGF